MDQIRVKPVIEIISTSVIATLPGAIAPVVASLPPIVVTGGTLLTGYVAGSVLKKIVRSSYKKFQERKNKKDQDKKDQDKKKS